MGIVEFDCFDNSRVYLCSYMVCISVFYIVSGDVVKFENWHVISGVFKPGLCRETPKSHSFTMRLSFNTEREGGHMVKEWDFEAGNFFKISKKIK